MDAGPLGILDRTPGGVDVGLVGAGEAADHRALDLARDRLHGLEVAGRGDREPGLDHVDAEARELLGDLHLLLGVERDPRRLLAVAERGVEDVDAVCVCCLGAHGPPPSACFADDLVLFSRLRAAQRSIPLAGEQKVKRQAVDRGASFGARSLAQHRRREAVAPAQQLFSLPTPPPGWQSSLPGPPNSLSGAGPPNSSSAPPPP